MGVNRGAGANKDEQALHDNIEHLHTVVSGLEERKKELDLIVENHQANDIEYKRSQVLLNELLKDIEIKKGIIETVTGEMNVVSNDLFLAKKELEEVNLLVEKKAGLIIDVEKLQGNVVSIQGDMEKFEDDFQENKKLKQKEADEFNAKLVALHQSLQVIIES